VRQLLGSVVFITVLGCVPALAQIPANPATLIVPSPVGIVFSAGKWIYDQLTAETVYYIEVGGQGRTPEEARLNGFRLAVERAVGSVVASETEVNNARISRDEIISYASGYVERYEIVKSEPQGAGYQVNMKVWIKRSALANRLLNTSKAAGDLEGAKVAVQLQTLQYERAQGDKLIQLVLNDFYRRAFDIELKSTQIKLNDNRQALIIVPFRLGWNRDYLTSLFEALKATSQNSNKGMSQIALSTGGFMGGKVGTFGFSDTSKAMAIYQTMIASQPSVELTVLTHQDRVMHRECFYWSELDHMHGYAVRAGHFVEGGEGAININGNFSMNTAISLGASPAQLNLAQRVELKIVPKAQCQN
jgi:hypothetical protein